MILLLCLAPSPIRTSAVGTSMPPPIRGAVQGLYPHARSQKNVRVANRREVLSCNLTNLSFASYTTWLHLVIAQSHWLPQTSLSPKQIPGRCGHCVILSKVNLHATVSLQCCLQRWNFHTANSLEYKKLTYHKRTSSLVNTISHP